MYQVTKTTSKGEVETIETNLSLKQAKHLLKGLHKIKCSARKFGSTAVSKITNLRGCLSFSYVIDVNDAYITAIYAMEEIQ